LKQYDKQKSKKQTVFTPATLNLCCRADRLTAKQTKNTSQKARTAKTTADFSQNQRRILQIRR